MSRLIVLLVFAWLACQQRPVAPSAPAPSPSAQTCPAATIQVLQAAFGDQTALACLAAQVAEQQQQFADVLATINGSASIWPSIQRTLERIPAQDQDWYQIARLLESRNAFITNALLDLAGRSQDLELRLAVSLARLRLVTHRGDHARAMTVLSSIIASVQGDDALTSSVLGELIRMDDREAIPMLCHSARGPSVTWPCAEHDPGDLNRYLGAIAELPLLSFSDASRLQDVDTHNALPGLDCLSSAWKFDLDQMIRAVNTTQPGHGSPAEVTIYYRLHQGAPEKQAQCFLYQSTVACLREIWRAASCPLPFVLGDLVRTLDPADQEKLIAGMINMKNQLYGMLGSGNKEGAIVLLHLHIVLAEALVGRKASDPLRLPEYHLSHALMFWKRQPDASAKFFELLTPDLRKHVCEDPDSSCRPACVRERNDRAWPQCAATCRELNKSIRGDVCGSP